MKTGVFTKTYHSRDLKQLFAAMKADGMEATQFNLTSCGLKTLPEKIDDGIISGLREVQESFAIPISALSGTFNMIGKDEEQRKEEIRRFGLLCEISRRIVCPIITLCTGSRNADKWKWDDDNLLPESYELLLDTTTQILKYARDNGITLAVEPEPSNIIFSPAKAREYLDEVKDDHLKICMDGANLFTLDNIGRIDATLEEAFALLGRDIVIAHGKDLHVQEGKIIYCGSGKGILNFPLFKKLLAEHHYAGPIIMHGLAETEVKECGNYLKECR